MAPVLLFLLGMDTPRFSAFVLTMLLAGCSGGGTSDAGAGGAGGETSEGGEAPNGDGGAAAEAGAAPVGGGPVEGGGGAGPVECEDEEGDPECDCSSSSMVPVCACDCGGTLVEDIDSADYSWECEAINGEPCGKVDFTFGECVQTGSYKLCGP